MNVLQVIISSVTAGVAVAGALVAIFGQFGRRHRLKFAVEVREAISANIRAEWEQMIERDALAIVDRSTWPVFAFFLAAIGLSLNLAYYVSLVFTRSLAVALWLVVPGFILNLIGGALIGRNTIQRRRRRAQE